MIISSYAPGIIRGNRVIIEYPGGAVEYPRELIDRIYGPRFNQSKHSGIDRIRPLVEANTQDRGAGQESRGYNNRGKYITSPRSRFNAQG